MTDDDAARLAQLAQNALPTFDAVLDRCRTVMSGFAGRWWVGGGWACDAPTGVVSRPHLDIDIVLLRPDVVPLARRLRATWDVRVPRRGELVPWDGRGFDASDHQLWLRPDDGRRPERWQEFALDPGFLEVLAEEVDDDGTTWRFRRDPAVCDEVERLGPSGGFLSPEVALLYKAANATSADDALRSKSQRDFDHSARHLDDEPRAWLAMSVARAHGRDHPWIEVLRG